MGLINSSHLQSILAIEQINLNEWLPVKLDTQTATDEKFRQRQSRFIDAMTKLDQEYLNYSIFRHVKSKDQIDGYALSFSSQEDAQYYFTTIKWRNQCQQLVHARYISSDTGNNSLCSGSYQFNIFFEHVKVKLSHITDFPFPENLYVLYVCLKGYYQIYRRISNFRVREDQICITSSGKVKIWINSNLSKNEPENFDILEKEGLITEYSIVQSIIKLVDDNTDKKEEPINFVEYLKGKRLMRLKFDEAIETLKRFAWELRVTIPMQLSSILGLINHQCSEDEENLRKMKASDASSGQIYPNHHSSPVNSHNSPTNQHPHNQHPQDPHPYNQAPHPNIQALNHSQLRKRSISPLHSDTPYLNPAHKIQSHFSFKKNQPQIRPRLIQSRINKSNLQNVVIHTRNASVTSNYHPFHRQRHLYESKIFPDLLPTLRHNSVEPPRMQSRLFINQPIDRTTSKPRLTFNTFIKPKPTEIIGSQTAPEWKYFTNNQYQSIDPEIAADLKKFI